MIRGVAWSDFPQSWRGILAIFAERLVVCFTMRCKIGIFQGSFMSFLFFAALAAAIISFTVYGVYLRQMLQIRWRRWLTQHYVDMWLRDPSYYRLNPRQSLQTQSDQRISEDIS